MSDRLDILAIAAHPDDAELAAGGTLILSAKQGLRVGILDLTRGELGTRGTAELRDREAEAAAAILGLSMRENLRLPDGNITSDGQNKLVGVLRQWRPRIVMTHPEVCRHPDHMATHHLVRNACFYSGLKKLNLKSDTLPWRPKHLLYFAEVRLFEPTFVVDISSTWKERTEALLCYGSQVHSPAYKEQSAEPETYISNTGFIEWVEARARTYGQLIGCTYGEPFQYSGTLGTSNLSMFLHMEALFQ
ncbi:MAG: bacillithiol biosynthesis deacetylase BshB1 [Bacteroidetes bacterium]|nr:bacillithiol biosynthesis deacetylase BshB1 [Bacteroidota bacterium]MCY4205753.1 bacillithiol biosynthesis deacetylase BshB1 [Bacteroidota bacterium]